MELKIITQMDPGILPEIRWNNEELKKEVAAKAAEYKAIAYTDTQETEMRKDRAALNKLVTAFENQRKQVKKFYNAPYDKFEAQVKEVLLPVREAIQTIDNGLSEIERDYRVKKTNKMRELYEASVGDLRMILPFEKTVREEWYKKAFTDKKLEQAYIDFFSHIREDMEALEELPERFRDKAALRYVESFNLSDALREGKRLEEIEKAMEERRRQQEEKLQELGTTRNMEETGTAEEQKKADTTAEAQVNVQESTIPAGDNATQESLVCLDFRVWGTRDQIMGIRKYLLDNGIRFGKVE